jgi:error-prone DNA polymerase
MEASGLPDYAELFCLTNFSFLQGASHAEELVERAAQLGYAALAISDECSLAGVVRAHAQAKRSGLPLIIGAHFHLTRSDGGAAPSLLALAQNRDGYGNLSEIITLARTRAAKGRYLLTPDDFTAPALEQSHLKGLPDCLLILLPAYPAGVDQARLDAQAAWMAASFPGRAWIGLNLLQRAFDDVHRRGVEQVAVAHGLPLVALGHVLMHVRSRKPLQDTLCAVRIGKPLAECGYALAQNAEQHLRARLRLANLYPAPALRETLRIASLCHFSLDELRYEYPDELVPAGQTPASYLRSETWAGARGRFPDGIPAAVGRQIEHELALIASLAYEPYFLTVHDIVRFARSAGILCQGRGSAANSAVCYCLGITEVDPARANLLFERFISKERAEPPDIDVDFEHQRREEVIQYIYRKYGRGRAALAAAVITYRPKSALRDSGKALGVDPAVIEQVASAHHWFDGPRDLLKRLAECGLDPQTPLARQWAALAQQLLGFPRHLSQHSGGFVIARGKLSRLVPIENAAMLERSVIEWDKDDLEELGLMKVDVLALGMLSALRRALDLVGQRRGRRFALQDIPAEDAATYRMMCAADTVGVFQIESRAQMSMLPRLRPATFYDLVIEVALVRPGPIQGGMVHPYLRRRQGVEPVSYPTPQMEAALGRTLGVPIFQEQVMQVAILAAAFLCALLNSQPMGFYGPSQLVQDARRHGVAVHPVDVAISGWDAALEGEEGSRQPGVRLGLSMLHGMRQQSALRIEQARAAQPFTDVADLARRAGLDRHDLQVLAGANALLALAGNRRQALWQAVGAVPDQDLLRVAAPRDEAVSLAPPSESDQIVGDYRAMGLTLGRHPLALLRATLLARRFMPAATLAAYQNGQLARACGIVTVRQRPGTANGVLFLTLEDETGSVNVIVWPALVERQRQAVLAASLLGVYGVWQCDGAVRHLIAKRLVDLSALLGRLRAGSRDFC